MKELCYEQLKCMSDEELSKAIAKPEESSSSKSGISEPVTNQKQSSSKEPQESEFKADNGDTKTSSVPETRTLKSISDDEIMINVSDVSEDECKISSKTEKGDAAGKKCIESVPDIYLSPCERQINKEEEDKNIMSVNSRTCADLRLDKDDYDTKGQENKEKTKESCNPKVSQLLEMELRQRALEAELRRANSDNKRQYSESDTGLDEHLSAEDEVMRSDERESEESNEQLSCEDAISVHPQCNDSEEEFSGSWERGEGTGQGKCGIVNVGEFLEERLRERALQAMLKKKDSSL